jgi:hypothetical protein
MAKLTALQPINHDGRDYADGDTLTVTNPAQIVQLVDSGAAVVEGTKTRAAKALETADAAAQAARDAEVAAAAEAATKEAQEAEAVAAAAAAQGQPEA